MKLWLGFAVFIWLLCGLIGQWWLGSHRWETIAKGPISLAKAYKEAPPSYPGPG